MQIWLVRHALAVEAHEFDGPDSARPLTEKGRRRFQSLCESMRKWTDGPTRIITSPYVRAVETAMLLTDGFGLKRKDLITDPEVGPGTTARSLVMAAVATGGKRIAFVGHQPDLSVNCSALMGGGQIHFGKGCIAALEFNELAVGSGQLLWFLGPRLVGD